MNQENVRAAQQERLDSSEAGTDRQLIVSRDNLSDIARPVKKTDEPSSILLSSDDEDEEIVNFTSRIEKRNRNYEYMTTPKWYIISEQSPYKNIWDSFIILLAVYNGIYTPLEIAFDYVKN